MPRNPARQAEISAMDRISNAMDSLAGNDKATRRVTMWFVDEYASPQPITEAELRDQLFAPPRAIEDRPGDDNVVPADAGHRKAAK